MEKTASSAIIKDKVITGEADMDRLEMIDVVGAAEDTELERITRFALVLPRIDATPQVEERLVRYLHERDC